jgi:hypothetical protein
VTNTLAYFSGTSATKKSFIRLKPEGYWGVREDVVEVGHERPVAVVTHDVF